MNKTALTLSLLLANASAHAAGFCVDTPEKMQQALDTAAASPEADVITIRTVGLATPPLGFSYVTGTDEPRDLTIRGGYGPFCLARGKGAKSTIDAAAVTVAEGLKIEAANSVIRLSNLVFINMPDNGDLERNSAVSINNVLGEVDVEASAFILNAGVSGSALSVYAPGGMVRLADNIIADNQTRNHAVAVAGFGSIDGSVECEVVNNTVTRNHTVSMIGGMYLAHCAPGVLSNNVLWGNDGADLAVEGAAGTANYEMRYNDHGGYFAFPEDSVTEIESIDANPGYLIGTYNYDPQPNSPIINAGDPATSIAANPLDYHENPRINDGIVDLGAVEKNFTILRDGFE